MVNKNKLNNIAEIRSGYLFRYRLKHNPAGNISVIQLRDLNENSPIQYQELIKISGQIDKFSFLNKGDIIFKAKSNKRVAAVISEDVPNLVATMHYFIISLKDNSLNPEYLAWFLNQRTTQEYFNLNAMGTRIPVVNKVVLADTLITCPDEEKQELIVRVDNLKKREQELLDQIKYKRDLLINKTLGSLLKS